MISSKSIVSMFLIYFSIVLKFESKATLLVIMVSSYWSTLIKSAMISDLMFFSTLLILVIYLPDKIMNFDALVKLIETSTCFLKCLLEIMLSFGLSFLGLLIVLCTSLIFFDKRPKNFSLILRISLMLNKETCTYNHPLWVLLFITGFLLLFWKNFNFSKIFLLGLGGIGGGILEILVLFLGLLNSFFFSGFSCKFFGVNLAKTHW